MMDYEILANLVNFFGELCDGNQPSLDFAREHGDISYIADDGTCEVMCEVGTPEEAAKEYAEGCDIGEGGVYHIYVHERLTVFGIPYDYKYATCNSYDIVIDPEESECEAGETHD